MSVDDKDRGGTTRRRVLQGALGGGAAVVASASASAGPVRAAEPGGRGGAGSACGAAPRPIPFANKPPVGNIEVHAFPPKRGVELVDITDFHGFVGVANVTGTGTETNLRTGERRTGLPYSVDLRFFAGEYVGVDGRVHRQTFSGI
ncbi:MAG: hypothetical protein ACRDMV_20095 [Streptosporangiales bacterium]